jgi:4-hydroxybenzoate polyprenyltransferase
LVRLPNVFTVIADVGAAFLFVAQGPEPVARLIVVLLAGVSLYWAGMVLNDVFDIEKDRLERADRPLAAGHISLRQAKIAGWGLLLVGFGLAAISGYLPSQQVGTTWIPAVVAAGLVGMIVAYDGPLKATALAPAAMGSCRVLSFLLGASVVVGARVTDGSLHPRDIIAIALGFGVYIMGITTMARDEASEPNKANLQRGLMFTLIGAAMLALAPQTALRPFQWNMDPNVRFPILISLIVFPVILRGLRAAGDPTPEKIQVTIKIGVLTIIPLAAAYAFLGAGPRWGLAIFALVIPSIVLASRFRVT